MMWKMNKILRHANFCEIAYGDQFRLFPQILEGKRVCDLKSVQTVVLIEIFFQEAYAFFLHELDSKIIRDFQNVLNIVGGNVDSS